MIMRSLVIGLSILGISCSVMASSARAESYAEAPAPIEIPQWDGARVKEMASEAVKTIRHTIFLGEVDYSIHRESAMAVALYHLDHLEHGLVSLYMGVKKRPQSPEKTRKRWEHVEHKLIQTDVYMVHGGFTARVDDSYALLQEQLAAIRPYYAKDESEINE